MYYYIVTAKTGHCGRNKYTLGTIPITATSASEASRLARNFPRVKHDHKDAIRNVVKVTYEDYINAVIEYNSNPYNKCQSIQDQRRLCPDLYEELIEEEKQFKKDWRQQKDYDKQYNKKRADKYGYKNGKKAHSKHLSVREYYDYAA